MANCKVGPAKKRLEKVLGVLQAHLVIQTKEQARKLTSVDRAEEALAMSGA